jgi:hypothetical protein
MGPDHPVVIHLVDVISREDQNTIRTGLVDGIDVLVNCISGSLVPGTANPLLGRQDLNIFLQSMGKKGPAVANVPLKRERLVLYPEK